MFTSIINNLKTKEIISSSDVQELREYIKDKYPDCSSQQVSAILADAIKKVINNNIPQFDNCYKQAIRENVLKKAALKENFYINAEDIFRSCFALKIVNDDYLSSFTHWINKYETMPITQQQVKELAYAVCKYDEQSINYELDTIITQLSAAAQIPILTVHNKEQEVVLHNSRSNLKKCIVRCLHRLYQPFRTIRTSYKTSTAAAFLLICAAIFTFNSKSIITADSGVKDIREQVQELLSIGSMLDRHTNKNIRASEYLYDIEHDLHEELKYKAINKEKLKSFLQAKNSILTQEPYFSTIVSIAEQYNINPLLMFAITGQEQGFVPADTSTAKQIANNPFNVYGSWQKYNTNISDSAAIAARTILNLGKNRPVYRDPIEWINRKYAEDKEWWKSVRKLFKQLEREVEYLKLQ